MEKNGIGRDNGGGKTPCIIIHITHNKKFKMYRQNAITPTSLEVNEAYEGETIEDKVARLLANKEPIEDSAPMIWTERKEGVIKEYDIRHDRFETAVEQMDIVNQKKLGDRKLRIASRETPENKEGGDGNSGNLGEKTGK